MKIFNPLLKKLNMMCFFLIEQCVNTNASQLTITQDNVKIKGQKVGNWEIIVKKK